MRNKTMSSSDFKAKCLALLETVGPEGLVITKRGKPVARLLPFSVSSDHLIGSLAGQLEIGDDVLSTGVAWHAEP